MLLLIVQYVTINSTVLLELLLYSQEYFEFIESQRNLILSALVRKYHGIGPLLIKVEGLVVQSNTGQSPKLRGYYSHWEKRAFDAIVKVLVLV